ncbi:hypothetical protein GPECTOR_1230g490 [Gonium pectorale]|uniref:Uncharacterized protein n=1 Tax=Gonium pectorale TaxID=33097 RepID=A0A150FV82_GONPE|nr:hypothetical protein GPECTOR_1230g490 [Gonium pectorale]|eukprot:KXZ40940.1 hypothetical protein GPECTOR_1230g490 [Gonium pectorale]
MCYKPLREGFQFAAAIRQEISNADAFLGGFDNQEDNQDFAAVVESVKKACRLVDCKLASYKAAVEGTSIKKYELAQLYYERMKVRLDATTAPWPEYNFATVHHETLHKINKSLLATEGKPNTVATAPSRQPEQLAQGAPPPAAPFGGGGGGRGGGRFGAHGGRGPGGRGQGPAADAQDC